MPGVRKVIKVDYKNSKACLEVDGAFNDAAVVEALKKANFTAKLAGS